MSGSTAGWTPFGRLMSAGYWLIGAVVAGFFGLRRLVAGRDNEWALVFEERLGRWRRQAARGPVVWIHAASVGETMLARILASALRERAPRAHLLLTCNTVTGRAVADKADVDEIHYFPVDYAPIVRHLVTLVRPRLFITVETEIWPATLLAVHRTGAHAAVVNARISPRAFSRYLWVAPLMAPALASLSRVCARDGDSAVRWRRLGASEDAVVLTGDMKFDAIDEREVAATDAALAGLGEGTAVLLAASTHEGEDEVVVEAYRAVRAEHEGLRLVVAPRHPERAAAVSSLLDNAGLRSARWSEGRAVDGWEALVVDTVGELRGFFKSALAVFMGGSLVEVGGHNLLEPAVFGLPMACGPHLGNVSDQAEALRSCGALVEVTDAASLAQEWRRSIEDPRAAGARGQAGRDVVAASRGAVERTLDALAELLPQ